MTKWFDTNYHYLVPEIGPAPSSRWTRDKVLAEFKDALAQGIPARPVIIGPVTFLLLSKAVDGGRRTARPARRAAAASTPSCWQLPTAGRRVGAVRRAGAGRPTLPADAPALAEASTTRWARLTTARRSASRTYFGDARRRAAGAGPHARSRRSASTWWTAPTPQSRRGRRSWPTRRWSPASSTAATSGAPTWTRRWASCASLLGSAGDAAVSHVLLAAARAATRWSRRPISTTQLRSWLAFARQKVDEVVTLAAALNDGRDAVADEIAASNAAVGARARRTRACTTARSAPASTRSPTSGTRTARRGPPTPRSAERAAAPAAAADHHHRLVPADRRRSARPAPALRRRRDRRRRVRAAGCRPRSPTSIALQEELGLDVLVHGEPERNDMVQYFAEQLDGFSATENGWVQSYGTRCVRPPILYGDVARPHPMTVGVGHLRPVADRQAGQGHADRAGHDPGLVVRARRPAAGRDRQPGRAGHPRRDRRPARRPASRSSRSTSRPCASCCRCGGPTRTPTWTGRSGRSGWPPPAPRTRRRSTPTCATRSSARSSTRSPTSTPT